MVRGTRPGTPERADLADESLIALLGVAEEQGFSKIEMVDAMSRLLFDLRERTIDHGSNADNSVARGSE